MFSNLETLQKRKNQICKTYTCKTDYSHLSKIQLNHLNYLFLEAKWLCNAQLASNDIFTFDYKVKEVLILNKNKQPEQRKIKFLSSQMRQSIVDQNKRNVMNLSKSKKKGNIVGCLKFKSRINSIPLKQFNITYKILNNKYIHIQGFKKDIKVQGLSQIPPDVDFANAVLTKHNKDFFIKITCFLPKVDRVKTDDIIGLDFGIETPVTESTGIKHRDDFLFPETKQLKKISRKLNKKKLHSKNFYKQQNQLQKQYDKISNRKINAKNQYIHNLTTRYNYICIQNDSIRSWSRSKMRGFGKRIQHSIIGGIISDLKTKPETLIVSKNFPSTKLCPVCGSLNKISLHERVYHCDCSYEEDRDIHSAINILIQAMKLHNIDMEHINLMPVESKTSCTETSNTPLYKVWTMNQEAFVFKQR